jgi:hypothetical protein
LVDRDRKMSFGAAVDGGRRIEGRAEMKALPTPPVAPMMARAMGCDMPSRAVVRLSFFNTYWTAGMIAPEFTPA